MDSTVNTSTKSVGFPLGLGIFFLPYIFAWFLLRKQYNYSKMAKIISFGWMAFVLFVFFVPKPAPAPEQVTARTVKIEQDASQKIEAERQKTAAILAAMPTITAAALQSAYDENTVAADNQFKGKQFKVSGTVSDISTDFMGNPYITMRGTNQFMQPQFQFEKSDMGQIASLKKGMKLTLLCTGRGDVAKTPMSKECSIL